VDFSLFLTKKLITDINMADSGEPALSKNKLRKDKRQAELVAALQGHANLVNTTTTTTATIEVDDGALFEQLFSADAWFHRADVTSAMIPLNATRLELLRLACTSTKGAVATQMALDMGVLPVCILDPPLMRLLTRGCCDDKCRACKERVADGDARRIFTAQELFCEYWWIAVYHLFDGEDRAVRDIEQRKQSGKGGSANLEGHQRAFRMASVAVADMASTLAAQMRDSTPEMQFAAALFSSTTDDVDKLLRDLQVACGKDRCATAIYTLRLINMLEMTLWSELVKCTIKAPPDIIAKLALAAPLTQPEHMMPFVHAICDQPSLKGAVNSWIEQMNQAYRQERTNPKYTSERGMHAPPDGLIETLAKHSQGHYAPSSAYLLQFERLLCLSRAPIVVQGKTSSQIV
jgi:hypothetical protein